MKTKRIWLAISSLMKDLKRTVSLVYVMGHIGRRMYRTALRRTGLVGLAALAVSVLGRGLGFLPQFSVGKAAVFTLLFGVVNAFGGLGLKIASNVLMSERINIAEANNLNLLEDKKKSRLSIYLRRLYESVFCLEAAVKYSPEEIREEEDHIRKNVEEIAKNLMTHLSKENLAFLGVSDLNDMLDHMNACNPLKPHELERSWEGFRITATYALTHPLPASLEREIIGFDLTLVEDWLDGACFDTNDVKLVEQYKANSTIAIVKSQVGYSVRDKLWQSWKAFSHNFWFQNTFRSLAINVGTQIKRMNKLAGSGDFKAEHFLWIHPELDRLVEQKFGPEILQELVNRRKQLIWKIFSRDDAGAVELLNRIFRPKIELAIDLREKCDVEYLLGELEGQSHIGDREKLGGLPLGRKRKNLRTQKARRKDELLARYLHDEAPSLEQPRTPLQRRALRNAAHMNIFRLGDLLAEYYAAPSSREDPEAQSIRQQKLQEIASQIAREEERFSHWLVTVRIFWLLNWLGFEEYCCHLREIAYAG